MTREREFRPSKELQVFIEAANRREPLPDLTVVTASSGNGPHVRQLLEPLSDSLRDYLGSPEDGVEFLRRYDDLVRAQTVLPKLAGHVGSAREDYTPGDGVMACTTVNVPVNLAFFFTADNKISCSGNFTKAVESIPPNRLRRCASCESVFAAVRSNSPCCSQKCRKKWNKKQSRKAQKKVAAKKTVREGKLAKAAIRKWRSAKTQ